MYRIKTIREEKGISQKALAEAANISAPFLYDLENDNRNAKPETLARIALALDCKVEELRKEDDIRDAARACN